MKRFLLLMICLLCCLALTACYQDSDPWPASDSLNAPSTAAVTAMPTQEPVFDVTAAPAADPAVQPTLEPKTVVVEDESVQPERTPGGGSDPGING